MLICVSLGRKKSDSILVRITLSLLVMHKMLLTMHVVQFTKPALVHKFCCRVTRQLTPGHSSDKADAAILSSFWTRIVITGHQREMPMHFKLYSTVCSLAAMWKVSSTIDFFDNSWLWNLVCRNLISDSHLKPFKTFHTVFWNSSFSNPMQNITV